MRAIFHFLYDCQVQPDDILDCLLEIKFVDGIIDLLRQLHKAGGYEVIIISDSNSVFIEHIMQVGWSSPACCASISVFLVVLCSYVFVNQPIELV